MTSVNFLLVPTSYHTTSGQEHALTVLGSGIGTFLCLWFCFWLSDFINKISNK